MPDPDPNPSYSRREQLHNIFVAIMQDRREGVQFQPQSDIVLKYPVIVYSRNPNSTQHADGVPYRRVKQYQVTVIDYDSDSEIAEKVADLPGSKHSRSFQTANLNHEVFDLFF